MFACLHNLAAVVIIVLNSWCSSFARLVIAADRKRNFTVYTTNSEPLCFGDKI